MHVRTRRMSTVYLRSTTEYSMQFLLCTNRANGVHCLNARKTFILIEPIWCDFSSIWKHFFYITKWFSSVTWFVHVLLLTRGFFAYLYFLTDIDSGETSNAHMSKWTELYRSEDYFTHTEIILYTQFGAQRSVEVTLRMQYYVTKYGCYVS